jgi:hypothetical protein
VINHAPRTFHLWKDVVLREGLVRIVADRDSVVEHVPIEFEYDLLTQVGLLTRTPVKDLVFRIERPTKVTVRGKYNWKLIVEAPDGGIVVDHDGGWVAPEDGYSRTEVVPKSWTAGRPA